MKANEVQQLKPTRICVNEFWKQSFVIALNAGREREFSQFTSVANNFLEQSNQMKRLGIANLWDMRKQTNSSV